MNWLDAQMALLDTATGAAQFAVNWLLQSTLLIAAGLAIGSLMRRRGSAAQALVYRTTLVAVLVCPIATLSLSLAGVSGWSVELPDGWTYQQIEPPLMDIETLTPIAASDVAEPAPARTVSREPFPLDDEAAMAPHAALQTPATMATDAVPAPEPPPVTMELPLEQSTETTSTRMWLFSIHRFGWAALGITATWLLVSALLGSRLAAAWRRLARLRRCSVRADSQIIRDCHELASMLGVFAPDVLRSPYLPSPCLVGLRKPAVLLPDGELGLSVRDVLIHELAHLKRRDCHWNLLRQAATALFFFQPLLWVLSRRTERTAEEVCDDYVIRFGSDRREYAHRLVDIAELSSVPTAAAGVGIVSLRSVLAKRVTRIMDTSRPLSTRVGNLLLAVMLAGGAIGTATVGLVGLGPQSSRAEAESLDSESDTVPNDEDDNNGSDDEAAGDDDAITVRGNVVDPDGRPVIGAAVHVARWYWDPDVPKLPLATTASDDDGRFEITYRKSQFNVDVQRPEMWKEVTVVASAEGFGPGWVGRDNLAPGEEPTLRLVHDDVPITGRVVDLEGNPLSGISIRVSGLAASADEDLDAWLEALGRGELLWEASNRYLGKHTPYAPKSIPETVRTKSDGSFVITGIGRERRVHIALEAPTIAYTRATIVTRKMQPIVATNGLPDPEWSRKSTVYGADLQIVAHPTQPIAGTVRDADTGDPLPQVAVESFRMTEHGTSAQRLIRVESDDQGRFRLVGMPKGPGKRIIAVPNDDQPYLMREFDVPDEPGLEPIEMDLGLHRGVWISGRVSDRATGEPVPCRVHYLPYRTNPFAQALPEFDEHGNVDGYQQRYTTSEEGIYRVVGLRGRAIVGVNCVSKPYPMGMGHEKIEGLDEYGHFPTYRNPVQPGTKWPTAMKKIVVAEDAEQVQLDFELDTGLSIKVTTVDQHGRELAGLNVVGQQNREHRQFVASATFDVVAFAPREERTLLFHHPEKQLGKALQVTAGDDAPQGLTVQLQPCAIIRGRLMDDNDQPITEARIRIGPLPGGDFSPELEPVATDAEGCFEHKGVVPGAFYNVMSESTQVGFKMLAENLAVAPGETINLGTIDVTGDERPDPVRKKAAPTVGASASSNRSAEEKTAGSDAAQDDVSQEYQGNVVDPAGEPVEGAELYLVFHIPQPTGLLAPTWKPVATTDAAGAFRFTVSPTDFGIHSTAREFGYGALVAVKDGFGFAWSQAGKYETSGKWLRHARARLKEAPAELLEQMKRMLSGAGEPLKLVDDDQPIRGRMVDINGQPVTGARLTLLVVRSGIGDDLTEWREAANEPKADYYSARMKTPMAINGPQVRSLVTPAVTDASGRFTLGGVGRGRIAELLVEGPEIESAKIFARTEAGEKIELLRERRSPDLGSYTYYPAQLTHVAGPSTAITGVVRDAQTKAPLGGVTVKSQSRHGERISGWGQDFVRAVTDEQGRYRLEGMPIGSDNRIAAIAPAGDAPYFSMSKRAATKTQELPLEIDFELRSGVWIEGRITDKQTGKGLSGRTAYYVNKESPSYQFARGLHVDERDRLLSDDEGFFRIAALPGPGFITFMAHEHENYPRAEAIVKPDGSREKVGRTMLETGPSMLMPQNYHLVAEIDPPVDRERVKLNLQLDGGNSVVGRVVGPDDRPVTDYYYSGQMAQFVGVWRPSSGDTFELKGYDPESPRHVYFAHRQQNLASHVVVKGELPGDFVVKLQPAGKVKGRLVDEDGATLANCQLVPWHPPIRSPSDFDQAYHAPPLPNNLAHWQSGRYETDDEGRFEISCLAPGVQYRLRASDQASMSPARGRVPRVSGPLDVIIQVAPGESKDLGDVRLADEAKFLDASKQGAKASASQPTQRRTVVTGQITLPGGKPGAGAHVAVIAMRIQPDRGGDLPPSGAVLAEGIVDEDGTCRLVIEGASSKTHRYANLIARKEGTAVAWKQLNLDAASIDASLELQPEEPIAGRLVDIEGQPAADVRLLVQSVMKRSVIGIPSRDGVGYRGGKQIPAAWLQPVTSDAQGRFTLKGVAAGQGVFLNVVGSDRFAPQDIALNTGMPEQRGERDGTYRALFKNVEAGEVAVLPIAPAQLFEGVVTFEDTGQPAPHARLTIWASQQEEFGSMVSVPGKADAEGSYRISPNPGVRFGITAYPPDGTPYLARRTPSSKAIRWKTGDRVRHVDLSLPPGVLVRGQVGEDGTDTPVAGASIQYVPERANNPNTADDILTGWQGIQLSDERGNFSIAVLPGPGRLLVHGPQGKYVLQEAAGRQLSDGKPGGRRNYVHAVQEVDPEEDAEPINVTLRLQPGITVSGRIVDEQGQSVDEVLVISRVTYSPLSLWWRGQMPPTLGGRFELPGLEEGKDYPVHFLDAKRRLGATAMIHGGAEDPTVVLKPCGTATVRYVDPEGNPHVGFRPGLHMIVTPGAHEYDWAAAKRGELAADADFVSNIDRTNYWPGPQTDNQGRVTFPALVPGATYRMSTFEDGKPKILKQFTVKSGQQLELGDITIDLDD